ncbi:MAG TPA: type II toxin-antitoxin system VapC family toxin [Tepidisphaeraceae bacterium]|jgi:predicted nucleic acid-binding protein|nr:type II toxin-antitoxin system VapC family toxin [Tepidisphaeraceae bacterium]
MPLVPDSSAILSLAYDDEDAAYAQQVLDAIVKDQAVIPTLFWFEIRNALLMGERRNRITPDQTRAFLADLNLLPFEIDPQHRETVLDLARQHKLTIYDAAYLELAHRRNLPLATIDNALMRAAIAQGVVLWTAPTRP